MNFLAQLALLTFLAQAPPPISATFEGIFRQPERGQLVLETENGQSLRMFVTGATKFVREGKPSRLNAFHDGDPVSVDAGRDMLMNLVATRVELAKPKPAKPDGAEKN